MGKKYKGFSGPILLLLVLIWISIASCLKIKPSPLDSSEGEVLGLLGPAIIEALGPVSLNSISPVNNATNVAPCTGNPCRASILLSFSGSMDATLSQTLTTEIWNGSTFGNIDNTGTVFQWSATRVPNDTLTIYPSWGWYPVTTQIRFTLSASGFQSAAGEEVITSDIQQQFTTTGNGQSLPLADTGQTLCYSNAGTIACSDVTFPGQDADFANTPNARSFTGPTAHGTFSTDYTTLDNVTGLRWKTCTEGLSGPTCGTGTATLQDWFTALNACSALNSANSGAGYWGLTNWRMPTQIELQSLVNYGTSDPAIDVSAFPATVNDTYWSLGTYAGGSRTFGVRFTGGTMNDGVWDFVGSNGYVRCVSSPATIQPPSFLDNGDGTISDLRTGLRWQKCSRGQTNDSSCTGTATTADWSTNLQYCDTLNLGSHGNASNWRMPNARELTSIYFFANGGLDSAFFPNTPSAERYSTSTTRNGSAGFILNRRGSIGLGANGKNLAGGYVIRCVSNE